MGKIQIGVVDQVVDGPSGWMESGGYDSRDSGREVQRLVKITGTFDGGESIVIEVDFRDDDPAVVVNDAGSAKTFTIASVFEILISPNCRFRTNLSGASAGTSITVKAY